MDCIGVRCTAPPAIHSRTARFARRTATPHPRDPAPPATDPPGSAAVRPRKRRPWRSRLSWRGAFRGRGVEATAQVELAGPDGRGDGVAPPRGRAGIDRVVGAVRVSGPVEGDPVTPAADGYHLDEAARGIRPGGIAAVPEEDGQLGFLRARCADPQYAKTHPASPDGHAH